ncbi:hypothetical protein [Bacillus sp. CECT 9360]|uniref:hypothetical protein n=1 Tax=Bacillus sp. CECT 9360 TaxID=2845821 RepID=UPI001E5AF1A1|nr:hypothetical protein [Bacillus sp. CECT 9360]CAH0346698.1 hypothetical protein BCI9360_03043 [Bacillus sp. CECT 9360]
MQEENQNLVGWQPKINISSAAKAVTDVADIARQIAENTIKEDIPYFFENIWDCVEGCGVSLDKIRLRLMHRAIQYITLVTPALCNVSYQWIYPEIIRPKVRDRIRQYPFPTIRQLLNPREAVWGNAQGQIEPPRYSTPIDPNTFIFDDTREAWVFIHGMLYKAVERDGSDFTHDERIDAFDFFRTFESEARVFNPDRSIPNPPNAALIDIYLISYDSEMSGEDERQLQMVLEDFVFNGNIFPTIAAAFWTEMKTRAEETATYIRPFLEELQGRNRGRAITHSLGCYVLAHAAQQMMENERIAAFSSWWCMSAAMRSDAFSNTGEYNLAPLIAGIWDGLGHGTSVWYSLADVTLQIIYPFGECATALGMTGLGVNDDGYAHDFDITKIVDVYHGPAGEYMTRLGSHIRGALNTGN